MTRHPGLHEFHSCALCREVRRRELFARIPSLPLALGAVFIQSLPKVHSHEGRSEQRPVIFMNWNLLFCDHRAIKLTQNRVCFINPCISLLIPSSVTREYHPEVLEFLHLPHLLPLTCGIHCLGFLERQNISVLYVLIFIPAWSHAAQNRSSTCWRPYWEDVQQYQIVCKKQAIDLAASNSDALVDSTVTVYPMHIYYEEARWQHTPLPESNQHCERLWFNFADTDTNVWAGILWLDGL